MNAHSRSDLRQSYEPANGRAGMSSHASAALPIHDARGLTDGGVQAMIDLDGQNYFLRITRAGKLILTK